MRKSTIRIVMLALISMSLFSCAKDSIEEEVTPYDQVALKSASYVYSDLEQEILDEVNTYRTEKGLSELQPVAEISVEAESHSNYMKEQGEISHDNFGARYTDLVNSIGAKAVGENVAYGYRTAGSVVNAWLNSDGHRQNIEGNYTHFGVAVVTDANGKNYYTNIFVRK